MDEIKQCIVPKAFIDDHLSHTLIKNKNKKQTNKNKAQAWTF